jgi:uncharacterized pyridoxamine 5'-phosphate oxidase family protein
MNKTEILDFMTTNPTHFLATTDGKTAYVRPFGTYQANEKGLYYFTQTVKDVYKQMAEHPEIETCYYNGDVTLRIRGRVKFIEDMALKQEIVTNRDFLKPQIEKNGWDYLKVFTLENAKAYVHDRRTTPLIPGAPKDWIDL